MSNLTLSFSDLSTAMWTLSRVWRKKSTLTSSFTDSLTAASSKFIAQTLPTSPEAEN